VRFTSPTAGASFAAGTLTLSWNSTGASPLTYNLLQSSDGGTTWTPLDVSLTGTTYSVDTTQISGGSKVMFQLEASDGLNTATATVGPLTVHQTPHLTPPQGAVNFNKVQAGVGGTQQVLLQNTGSGPLTVTSASTGGSFSVI